MEPLSPARVLAALDKLVLRRRPDGSFVREGPAPAWLARLGTARFEGALPDRPDEAFPFLAVFLEDAARAWVPEGEGTRVESEFWTETAPDGEEVHLVATARRFGDDALLVITRDERSFEQHRALLQRAREVRAALDALAREMEEKDILVHCIVHDLSNPLAAIAASLSTLAGRALAPDAAALVQIASDAAAEQQTLIREILDVFATEQGAVDAEPETLAPRELYRIVARVAAMLEPVTRDRRVAIDVALPSREGGPSVVADARRLERVLANLLDNALRYSPEGGRVAVRVELARDGTRVVVEDRGAGVRPDFVPQLFQKFARGRERLSRGTGLGLYFCRVTVERWGGAIGYEAPSEGGSRFWFWLRNVPAPARERCAGAAEPRQRDAR